MKISTVLLISCVAASAAGAQTVGCVKPGVFVMKARGDMRAAFSSMQVDSIFKGVTLSVEARKSAEIFVDEAKSRSPGVAKAGDAKHTEIMRVRNDRLVALLAAEGDKAKVRQNLEAMEKSPNRCDISG